MNCYIRREGAQLRPDLQTLDNWPRIELLDLAAKYVTGNYSLDELRTEINQVRSSSGNAPPHQMPDADTCPERQKRYISKRMGEETKQNSEAECRQECKS